MPRREPSLPGSTSWEAVVGDNVRLVRKSKNMTQAELATAAGMDLRYLGSIERGGGNPSLAVLGRLAKALGVHPSEQNQ